MNLIHVAILKIYTFICNTDSKELFACIQKQYYDDLRNEMFNQLWIESKSICLHVQFLK